MLLLLYHYIVSGGVCLEKIFTFFASCSHRRNFHPVIFLSHVNHYIEPMGEIFSAKIFLAAVPWHNNMQSCQYPDIQVQQEHSE